MEVLKSFGLNPYLFGAQVINFLIVLYLLKRFLYKPVLEVLKKRENTIKEGLKQAEEAKILMEKTTEKEKEILQKAREEARQTIAEAKNEASLLTKKMEEDSKKQAERIINDAREQISLESQEAEKRLTAKISELSVDFLQTSLKKIFSEKEQKEVLQKAIKELKPN